MRLQKYLTEVYVDSTKATYGSGGILIFDIYKNPTPSEIRELKEAEGRYQGFRCIVDFKSKNVYITNNNLIHVDMFKVLNKVVKMTSHTYHKFGSDSILTFSTYGDNLKGMVESDTINYWDGPAMNPSILKNLISLYKEDYEWLSKWFDPKEVKHLIEEIVLKHTAKG